MLKTNCKKVKETIKGYIMETATNWIEENKGYYSADYNFLNDLSIEDLSYNVICSVIIFDFEKQAINKFTRNQNRQNVFIEWAQGLPAILNCDYYYNVCAVDLLGEWLEETEEEKKRYSEDAACELITKLLYREISSHATNI